MKPVTLTTLRDMKASGTPIVCLTAYDATFAHVLDAAGVDVILVGDSLGMVMQGHDSTLPVSMHDMTYHAACVARGSKRAFRVVDLPFNSCPTPEKALANAGRLMARGSANMVKLEGGAVMLEVVQALTQRGIPVCAHLGLLPQSVNQIGGYKVQGRESDQAEQILKDALALQQAGAGLLVLECVPSQLAAEIARAVDMPVIGIGAGRDVDGQVLVLQDMLGITAGKTPKFAENFMAQADDIQSAVKAYVEAVRNGSFPGEQHTF